MTHPIHSGYIIGGVLACSCPCEHPALASALFTSSRHQRSPSWSLPASAPRGGNGGGERRQKDRVLYPGRIRFARLTLAQPYHRGTLRASDEHDAPPLPVGLDCDNLSRPRPQPVLGQVRNGVSPTLPLLVGPGARALT